MIVDADGQILGRMSTFIAKKALLGEDMIVVNAEKAIVIGKKDDILGRYSERLKRKSKGAVTRGPYHQRRPDRFVRKTIRGMLPWGKARGRDAYKKVMVYVGIPKATIKDKHKIDVNKDKPVTLDQQNSRGNDFLTVGEICKFIGGSW